MPESHDKTMTEDEVGRAIGAEGKHRFELVAINVS